MCMSCCCIWCPQIIAYIKVLLECSQTGHLKWPCSSLRPLEQGLSWQTYLPYQPRAAPKERKKVYLQNTLGLLLQPHTQPDGAHWEHPPHQCSCPQSQTKQGQSPKVSGERQALFFLGWLQAMCELFLSWREFAFLCPPQDIVPKVISIYTNLHQYPLPAACPAALSSLGHQVSFLVNFPLRKLLFFNFSCCSVCLCYCLEFFLSTVP